MTHSTRLNRRHFLASSALVAASLPAGGYLRAAEAAPTKFRCAVIGHTGRGDYGHGMELLFNRPDCEVVAIADPDEAGRAKAAERSKAARQYADYREMLAKEKPQIVSVAPRHTDQHVAMALAAIEVGAHLYMEKPIASSPAECDQILSAAERANRRIVVAHQIRMAPRVVALKKALDDGLIGDLLQIDAWGKQDPKRSGGEDMLVLGIHLFDLMRMFAGEPQWCTARVLQGGKEITKADARPASEPIGLVAGDEIFAQFAFPGGVNAAFNSRHRLTAVTGLWGMEFSGSKGAVRLLTGGDPRALVLQPGTWSATGRSDRWEPMADKPGVEGDLMATNPRLVEDLIDAIRNNREPVCSGRNGAKAVEMATAVWHAALSGARVPFPLADRKHPLV